jgi:hypothetical protein
MRIFHLTIVVAVSALSLATANAMPDLGRETGKFIRNDEPAPKGVRTFEPAKSNQEGTNVSFGFPFRPGTNVSFGFPFRPINIG